MAEQTTVGALTHRSIGDYLEGREVGEELAHMEGRIINTISRSISHLIPYQRHTRRVADISVAPGEHLRGLLMAGLYVQRAGEDRGQMIARTRDEFMGWLTKALAAPGEVMQMVKASMEPAIRLEEAADDLPDEDGSEGA